jgi:hypothetical protein
MFFNRRSLVPVSHCLLPPTTPVQLVAQYTADESSKLRINSTEFTNNTAATRGDLATLLRCLVLYSQWLLLVASLNIDWPNPIAYSVRVLAWMWSAANQRCCL